MSALIIYMSQVGNTVSSVLTRKSGIWGVRKSCAPFIPFPSHCRDATEGN